MNHRISRVFRYCRDKGRGFGHGAQKRDPVNAWLEAKAFLDAYTDYELTLPVEITLRVSNSEFDRNLDERIVSLLGKPEGSDAHWCIGAAITYFLTR